MKAFALFSLLFISLHVIAKVVVDYKGIEYVGATVERNTIYAKLHNIKGLKVGFYAIREIPWR